MTLQPIAAFWWRPMTGTMRQKALDFAHLRSRGRMAAGQPRVTRHMRNFGDELTPLILAALAPERQIAHTPLERCEIAVVGSILQRIRHVSSPMIIAGCGFEQAVPRVRLPESISPVLVRGHLSAACVGLSARGPVGDPGLAVPALTGRERSDAEGVVMVMHFTVARRAELWERAKSVAARLRALLIPSHEDVEFVIEAISRSRLVLTSSLHGLVVADAFGVPALPVAVGPSSADFRLADYHSAFGLEDSIFRSISTSSIEELEVAAARRHQRLEGPLADVRGAVLARLQDAVHRL